MTMKQNTTVRFGDASTQTVLVRDDLLNTAPLDVLWYTAKDYEQFRQDAPGDTVQNSCRRQFVESLLLQQNEHEKIGIVDPKGLFVLSKACSKIAKERARQIAKQNAQDVAWSAKEGSTANFLQSTPLTNQNPKPNTILAVSA
jgi:hypothetical protein